MVVTGLSIENSKKKTTSLQYPRSFRDLIKPSLLNFPHSRAGDVILCAVKMQERASVRELF